MEKLLTELANKIKTLNFRVEKTSDVLSKNEKLGLERHVKSLKAIVEAITSLKETIEEKKFAKGEEQEEISVWSASIDAEILQADERIRRLELALKALNNQEKEREAFEEHLQALKFDWRQNYQSYRSQSLAGK